MTRSKPQTPAHHAVSRLRVTGGFLGGVELELADGLNCLIGGRGTGKTTALEFLRFGLGLMPDPRTHPQRHRAIDTLVKANLGGGRLSIELVTKTGMRYTAERGAAESVQVVNEAGTAVPVSLDRDQIFGADVFSQNQIEEIASNPAAQLALLDRFVEAETAAIARDLEGVQRQLDQMAADLRRLDDEIDDLGARASEVPVIQERLKGVAAAGGPDAAKINAAHAARTARDREAQIPEQLIAASRKAATETAAAAVGFHSMVEAQLDGTVRGGASGDLFTALEADIQVFDRALVAAASQVARAAAAAETALGRHHRAILERHAVQEAEYRKMMSQLEEEGGRAAERAALQTTLAAAVAAAKQREAKDGQRRALLARRTELLAQMSELRDRRFAARKRVAERLTRQLSSIRVTVTQAADSEAYRELVARALKGSAIKQNVAAERLAEVFLPIELARAVVSGDQKLIAERTGFDEERCRKIVDALRDGGGAYEIESVDLEDVPCIELLDGGKYKQSPNLSTGQRCTTILPILLVQSERPLLIDQPEDNLDNAFIYDTIVQALRAAKGARQVIFVTHNPNIPVLGEADRVFVFESDGHHARLRRMGSVDECKEDIETILEGGREAFLQRKARYGH
ncbi:MAG TPA: AAA family ATPase [Kofleriaceae bacterium]|nr:AAA family ATPase [Kofleriaceae bacterium]